MTKEIYYTYLGTNGSIMTPVYLEGIYSTRKYRLVADENMILTDGQKKVKVVMVPEHELALWSEVDEQGQD